MKLTQINHSKKNNAWSCPKIKSVSANELAKKVAVSACSEYIPECFKTYIFR